MEAITKKEEIELLTALLDGNGYFAEKFRKDIPVMIENINRDFPIETGTSIIADEVNHIMEKNQLIQKHENEIRQLQKEHEGKL